ncbi:MAG: hypothetical protein IPP25_11225 [Saprospiraceae bacterium]|nr:hypothetical protein [Candidatus Opimibacter skivensis]
MFGKTFTNVYSVEPPNTHEDAIKIFYNSEFGMVSFIDGEGIEWEDSDDSIADNIGCSQWRN